MSPGRRLHLGSEVAQARALSAMHLAGAAGCLCSAWITPVPGAPRWVLTAVALLAAATGGLLLAHATRVRGWTIQILLAAFSLELGLITAVLVRDVAVVGVGPAVIAVGLYAGSFLSRRALGRQLAWALSTYLVGAWWGGTDPPVIALLVVVVVAIGAAAMLHHLTLALRRQAGIDPLTGAATRSRWTELTQLEFTTHPAAAQTVVIIDLDHFKAINDSRGHAAGDQVLGDLARAWRETLDDDALLGRLGGDEFVVLFPRSTADEVQGALIDLQRAYPQSWCHGLAERQTDESLTSMLSRADDQLRDRKRRRPEQPERVPR